MATSWKEVRWKVNPSTGCWNWLLAIDKQGYGYMRDPQRRSKKRIAAHRYVYEQYKGPIPDGMSLDHLCRNRKCVNPDHLEPVTHTENLRRGVGSKLSVQKAQEIRDKFATGHFTKGQLAREYGVGFTAIYKLLNNETWRISNATGGQQMSGDARIS